MTTYKDIKGTSIEVVSSDPSNPLLGQIWYNTTSQTLKGLEFGAAAWSTGGNMGTGRSNLGGTGTQTAAVVFGGIAPGSPGNNVTNLTEEYNGSSWTNGGNMGTARRAMASAGTQTAALGSGGYITPGTTTNVTEEYNGSAWTGGGAMNTARQALGGWEYKLQHLVLVELLVM